MLHNLQFYRLCTYNISWWVWYEHNRCVLPDHCHVMENLKFEFANTQSVCPQCHEKCPPNLLPVTLTRKLTVSKQKWKWNICNAHCTAHLPNLTLHNIIQHWIVQTLLSSGPMQVALVKCGKVLEILKSFANFESTYLKQYYHYHCYLNGWCIIFKIKATVVSRYIDIDTILILLAGKAGNLINILWWYLKMYRFHRG